MYYIYVLWSISANQCYVGSTRDVEKRVERHNAGMVPSTRRYRPWKLVYVEQFHTRSEAIGRESEIKNWKNPSYMVKKLDIKIPFE
jgi:putative endonuclease